MQGLHGRVLLAVAVATVSMGASAQYTDDPGFREPFRFSAPLYPRDDARRGDVADELFFPTVYREKGAAFIKLHFSRFELPAGITVEVSNPMGTETWRYAASDRDLHTIDHELGDDGQQSFWAMSVSGDTAVVRLTGDLSAFDPERHGIEIDTHYGGASLETAPAKQDKNALDFGSIETTCGESERYDAICWADSHPDHYERALPVALIVTTTGKQCTAWRVGSDNRMFTARHCIGAQSALDGAEVWFDYEHSVCGGDVTKEPVKVTGDQLLATDYKLDFTLFTVNDFSRIRGFGNLGLDLRDGTVGEEIFIPQHGLGNPKQIAIESDMNAGGLCAIDDNDVYGFSEGSDIGYMCDTVTSSSGSPVISAVTGRAIALHHWGGCYNSGTKLSRIWPLVSDYFNGVPDGDAAGDWAEPNQAPVARYAADCEGLSCRFDAGASSDSDGSISGWTWSIDGEVLQGQVVEHEFPKGGQYTVALTVSDDEGATDSLEDTITVDLPNQAPEARFSSRCIDDVCSFDASSSSDPDGSIVSWSWDLGNGSTASGETLEHRYEEDGNYWVTLTVNDDSGESHSAGHSVTVNVPNQPPEASWQVECNELSCTFDAAGSLDTDGAITSWRWVFGDGQEASGEQTRHEYAAAGRYAIRLEVTDDEGATAESARTVEIGGGNVAPAADFNYQCAEGLCRFDATNSSDSDGRVVDWSWDFGDGAGGTGAVVEHRYDESGTFAVRLGVSDDDGAGHSVVREVSVEVPADKDEDTANAPRADFSVTCTGLTCTLDAGSSTASEGSIVSYSWSLGDGTAATGGSLSHEYARDGSYTVTLKVTDSSKASSVNKRTIRVEARDPIALSATML